MELSLTEFAIQQRVTKMCRTVVERNKFVPALIVRAFRMWLNNFDRKEKMLIRKIANNRITEMERRLRWLKNELNDAVFEYEGEEKDGEQSRSGRTLKRRGV